MHFLNISPSFSCPSIHAPPLWTDSWPNSIFDE